MYDVIIIGIGPAGISAGIYLKRFNRNVLMIGKDFGVLDDDKSYIENYYGFEKIKGSDLIQKGVNQAKSMGIPLLNEVVVSIDINDDIFVINTQAHVYTSKALLLATGKSRAKLNVKNFNTFVGRGISYCSLCDGFLYRNKRIAVFGSGPYMMHELKILASLTKDVMIFTNNKSFDIETEYKVIKEPIVAIKGEEKVSAVETATKSYDIDGIFIAIDAPSGLEFSKSLGLIMEKNDLLVDANYMTNVSGLFAAGDIIGGKLQVAKAVSDGMHAAFAIHLYLKK